MLRRLIAEAEAPYFRGMSQEGLKAEHATMSGINRAIRVFQGLGGAAAALGGLIESPALIAGGLSVVVAGEYAVRVFDGTQDAIAANMPNAKAS